MKLKHYKNKNKIMIKGSYILSKILSIKLKKRIKCQKKSMTLKKTIKNNNKKCKK